MTDYNSLMSQALIKDVSILTYTEALEFKSDLIFLQEMIELGGFEILDIQKKKLIETSKLLAEQIAITKPRVLAKRKKVKIPVYEL